MYVWRVCDVSVACDVCVTCVAAAPPQVGALRGEESISFYGVFDGHGGATAADFCAEHLHENLARAGAKGGASLAALGEAAVRSAFLATDAEYLATPRQEARSPRLRNPITQDTT